MCAGYDGGLLRGFKQVRGLPQLTVYKASSALQGKQTVGDGVEARSQVRSPCRHPGGRRGWRWGPGCYFLWSDRSRVTPGFGLQRLGGGEVVS